MSNKVILSIITQEDLLLSHCFDIKDVISVVEETFLKYNEENVIFPDKVSVVFDQVSQNRINCLPAGFRDQEIYGMKWVSIFPENPHNYSLPNLSAVYILSELKTGFPIAFMEGALCSNLRTAAVGAVAAKFLARSDSECIGFIGAGEQAKAHFMAMKAVLPSLHECRISSRTANSEKNLFLSWRICTQM